MKKQIIKIFIVLAMFFVMSDFARAATFSDDFNDYNSEAEVEAAGWGLDYTTLESSGCRSGKCLKSDITTTGTRWYIMHDLNEAAPHIRFYAKRVGFAGTGGNKFLKLFGDNTNGYANITFGQEYTNGIFTTVNTGGGDGLQNDTQCNWYYSAHALPCTGIANTVTSNLDMENGRWYSFEVYVSPNADGNYDGAINVWVDGVLRLDYSGLKMRNDNNVRNFTMLSLVNYVGATLAGPYEMWFDDIVVSNSYIGPVTTGDVVAPSAPSGLIVI